MQEIGKFDVKVSVIPNGSEKYVAFTINKNLFLLKAGNSTITHKIFEINSSFHVK